MLFLFINAFLNQQNLLNLILTYVFALMNDFSSELTETNSRYHPVRVKPVSYA